MNFLTAIRIMLYFYLAYLALTQPVTIVTLLLGIGCLIMVVILYLVDYYAQVSYSEQKPRIVQNEIRRTGMWCRMCGGACDLENCGMEQP